MTNNKEYYLMFYYSGLENTIVIYDGNNSRSIHIDLNHMMTDKSVTYNTGVCVNYDKVFKEMFSYDFFVKSPTRYYTLGYITIAENMVNIYDLFNNTKEIRGKITKLYEMNDNLNIYDIDIDIDLDINIIFTKPFFLNLKRANKLTELLK
jgi:predicted RNA-binding protein